MSLNPSKIQRKKTGKDSESPSPWQWYSCWPRIFQNSSKLSSSGSYLHTSMSMHVLKGSRKGLTFRQCQAICLRIEFWYWLWQVASLVLGKLPSLCISLYLSTGAKKQLGSPEAEESKNSKKVLEFQCSGKAKQRQGTTCRDSSQDLLRRLLECLWNANTPAKLNIGSGLNARDFS